MRAGGRRAGSWPSEPVQRAGNALAGSRRPRRRPHDRPARTGLHGLCRRDRGLGGYPAERARAAEDLTIAAVLLIAHPGGNRLVVEGEPRVEGACRLAAAGAEPALAVARTAGTPPVMIREVDHRHSSRSYTGEMLPDDDLVAASKRCRCPRSATPTTSASPPCSSPDTAATRPSTASRPASAGWPPPRAMPRNFTSR